MLSPSPSYIRYFLEKPPLLRWQKRPCLAHTLCRGKIPGPCATYTVYGAPNNSALEINASLIAQHHYRSRKTQNRPSYRPVAVGYRIDIVFLGCIHNHSSLYAVTFSLLFHMRGRLEYTLMRGRTADHSFIRGVRRILLSTKVFAEADFLDRTGRDSAGNRA